MAVAKRCRIERNIRLLKVIELATNDQPCTRQELITYALQYGKSINATQQELDALLDMKLVDIFGK